MFRPECAVFAVVITSWSTTEESYLFQSVWVTCLIQNLSDLNISWLWIIETQLQGLLR